MIISTKAWEGEWRPVLERIKYDPAYKVGDELWLVVNNMRTDISEEAMACGVTRFVVAEAFIDQAEAYFGVHFDSGGQYSISELVELYLADDILCHYASDVIPPKGDFPAEAAKYLDRYPVVSADWDSYECEKTLTDFGFTDSSFSDQCYVVDARKFKPDYNMEHEIGLGFPEHGGNSFERRMAMYLSATNQKRAVLSSYRYHHIDRREK